METKENKTKKKKKEKEQVDELMKQVYEEQKRIHPEMYDKTKQ